MTLEEATAKAQQLYGDYGRAEEVAYGPVTQYKVGFTTLPARLGGYMSTVAGMSFISFENAFRAIDNTPPEDRHETGFENDDDLSSMTLP